jgi:acetyltransferase-like isoleucine patch superfamily enzyme
MWKVHEFKTSAINIFFQYPMYLHGGKYISIGENFNCGLRLRLEAFDEHLGFFFTPRITIGKNVSINHDCHIGAINEIIIEDGVLIASKVFITDHYHGEITAEGIFLPPSERKLFCKGSIKIEKNVWVGEGVVILPNVTIGQNTIIGANSVVTKDIPKNSVVGGNPARIIRTL